MRSGQPQVGLQTPQESDGLDSLAQPHLICQDTSHSALVPPEQGRYTVQLVVSERGVRDEVRGVREEDGRHLMLLLRLCLRLDFVPEWEAIAEGQQRGLDAVEEPLTILQYPACPLLARREDFITIPFIDSRTRRRSRHLVLAITTHPLIDQMTELVACISSSSAAGTSMSNAVAMDDCPACIGATTCCP